MVDSLDNFRRHGKKHHRHFDKGDGFLAPSSGHSGNTGSINFDRPETTPVANSGNIGDFKRPEGLTSFTQTQSLGVQDILGGREKKKRFRLGRHKRRSLTKNKAVHPWRRRIKRAAAILSVLIIISGGYLVGKAYLKSRQVFKGGGGAVALQKEVDPSQLNVEGDGRINILLLGKGGEGHTGPDLTDTILVASIDPIYKEAALVSIPRDMYVKIAGNGSTKINSVYANSKQRVLASGKRTPELAEKAEKAGLDSVQQIVKDVLGVPIHYRVMIDFEAFRKSIDTVGGITIDVKERLYDPSIAWENKNNPLIAAVGMQNFDGKKALLYARSRHGSAGGDFDRARRQREVILALKDKVLSAGTYSNPVKINQLLDAFGNHVQTDFNRDDIPRLFEIGKEIPSDKIMSIGLTDPPHDFLTTANIGGLSSVVPKAGTYNYKDIQSYIRNTLKDPYIRRENANVIILNGTGSSGLATKKADELKSYGYNVIKVGDAPTKNYQNTILVNLRGDAKKYTNRYLELRTKTTAVGKLPDGAINPETADFVIILGANETSTN